MRTSFDLKFYSDGIVFSFTKWPFQTITLKNVSTLYWKCLASNTGFKLSYLHLSKKSISFILSSGNSSTHYSAIIKRISFQCKSALLRVCLTLVATWCRNFAVFCYTFNCAHKTIYFIFYKNRLECFCKTLWHYSFSCSATENLSV